MVSHLSEYQIAENNFLISDLLSKFTFYKEIGLIYALISYNDQDSASCGS